MATFRYETKGNWYKGNTHIHSSASDGQISFGELAALYAGAGYDFLFRTDHWICSEVDADREVYPLLWLDGVELDGYDYAGGRYHVACLGRFEGITREMGFVAALEAARAQDGLLILAHPYWMGNSAEEAMRWGFDGVEIYNHVCQWTNGKGCGAVHWNAMLERRSGVLAFAVDDAHINPQHPGWDGGWIAINAAELSSESVHGAIRAGNFYSSMGPEFRAIEFDGGCVCVQTSPVQFIRLVGPRSTGMRMGSFEGKTFTEASLEVVPDWPYAYVEIEDTRGRRAWTNTLFVD